jgi:hypothetical protein
LQQSSAEKPARAEVDKVKDPYSVKPVCGRDMAEREGYPACEILSAAKDLKNLRMWKNVA